jgi:hypothetical protein
MYWTLLCYFTLSNTRWFYSSRGRADTQWVRGPIQLLQIHKLTFDFFLKVLEWVRFCFRSFHLSDCGHCFFADLVADTTGALYCNNQRNVNAHNYSHSWHDHAPTTAKPHPFCQQIKTMMSHSLFPLSKAIMINLKAPCRSCTLWNTRKLVITFSELLIICWSCCVL